MEVYVSASVHPEDDEGPSELAFSQNSIKKAGDAFGIPTDNLGSLREANSNPVQQGRLCDVFENAIILFILYSRYDQANNTSSY